MFEIDKKEFGAFLAELRKLKGMTQKELVEKMFVSDKAVSKWETGGSIPDVALLMPLAKVLGVTVSELLECRRYEVAETMTPDKADAMMHAVLQMTDEERKKEEKRRKRMQACFVAAIVLGLVMVVFGYQYFSQVWGLDPMTQAMPLMMMLFGLIFGGYTCFFAKEKLPTYYDENKISAYSDGFFRMNLPGVCFNNSNWKYILRTLRIWSIGMILCGPLVWLVACFFATKLEWAVVYSMFSAVTGGILLVSLFVSVYIVAKKYE